MKIFVDALSRIPTVSIGTQALIIGCLDILYQRFPGVHFILLSSLPEHDRSYLDSTGYPIEYIKRSPSQFGTMKQLRAIVKNVDAVASAWGDGYVATPSRFLLQKALAIKQSGVPLILVTASLGPFTNGFDKLCARWALSLFDGLTVRDSNSQRHVQSLGLVDVRCIPDTAFVLDPANESAVESLLLQEGVPPASIIGINPSILLHHRFAAMNGQNYVDFMVMLIENVRQQMQQPILLIPHQIYPTNFPGLSQDIRHSVDGDDRAVAEMIFDAMQDKEGVYLLKGDYSPAQYKGVLRQCDLFIGGRMHAVISAVSQSVPSVIMQYSHKASGLMEMLELTDCVWNCQDTLESLLQLIDRTWAKRKVQRNHLAEMMPGIITEAKAVGGFFADLIRDSKR